MNEHPGINCTCVDCESAKRRIRYQRRKAERAAPKPSEISLRAKKDNEFLYDMRIWQVQFDSQGMIRVET